MLSVVIRTNNGEQLLPEVLRPLISAAAEGVVRDVVFLDLGSRDGTAMIADTAGAAMVSAKSDGFDGALAQAHRGSWLLLLDQNTVLAAGWMEESVGFVERQDRLRVSQSRSAACFRPEHEPELGSGDLRRRITVLATNRLASRAFLSQGILVRRAVLMGARAPVINWREGEPTMTAPGLMRLRSRSYLARPLPAPKDEMMSAPRGAQVADHS